jgi:enolase
MERGVRNLSTVITQVSGRRVWDSRGRPTVEAEVLLASGVRGRAIAPAGASRGSHEAIDLRDGGAALGGFGVGRAVANVNGEVAAALRGMDARDQQAVDAALTRLDATPNLARLGGNAVIAVSMAVLHAAANAAGVPLWRHLAGDRPVRLPLPEIQIFGGGAHAGRRIDIQDLMVMPLGAKSFDEALEMVAEVYSAAGTLMAAGGQMSGVADEGGWWPDFDSNEEALETLARAIGAAGYKAPSQMAISLDIAASEFGSAGRYRLGLEGRELDRDAWLRTLFDWVRRYPIVSVEDPVGEDDAEGMRAFTAEVGHRVQVIGDDFLVTSAERVRTAIADRSCNAVLLKPNQAGTVSGMRRAMDAARTADWGTVVSARSGESEDVTIVHLAVGWNSGQLKVGSFSRSERMAKWNEALRIEAELGAQARFAGRDGLPAGVRAAMKEG